MSSSYLYRGRLQTPNTGRSAQGCSLTRPSTAGCRRCRSTRWGSRLPGSCRATCPPESPGRHCCSPERETEKNSWRRPCSSNCCTCRLSWIYCFCPCEKKDDNNGFPNSWLEVSALNWPAGFNLFCLRDCFFFASPWHRSPCWGKPGRLGGCSPASCCLGAVDWPGAASGTRPGLQAHTGERRQRSFRGLLKLICCTQDEAGRNPGLHARLLEAHTGRQPAIHLHTYTNRCISQCNQEFWVRTSS